MNDDVDRCPECQVRAYYTDDFVRVYQAYSTTIAQSAVAMVLLFPPLLV